MTQASAPGKVILFGEHAVVFERPSIAVPLPSIRATVEVDALPPKNSSGIFIHSPALGRSRLLSEVGRDDPLGLAVRLTLERLEIAFPPNMHISIHSDIPISAGLGSGAAVSVAIVRALGRHFARRLSDEQVSAIAYEVERLHHGTPSGVDNTVITYEQPVYFQRGKPVERFIIHTSFLLILAHCGESTPTSVVVEQVRQGWNTDKASYERSFDAIGRIVDLAFGALRRGDVELLGPLMDQNQSELVKLGVSSAPLDHLIDQARAAGAKGAKLSGGGQGGFMIALVEAEQADKVIAALQSAGAAHVLKTRVG